MIWLKSLGLKVWGYVAAGALGLLLLFRIYKEGEKGAKVDSLERTLESVRDRNKIASEVEALQSDDVIKQLKDRGWFKQ